MKKSWLYEYRFPEQETKLRAGKECVRCDTAEGVGRDSCARRGAARRSRSRSARRRRCPTACRSVPPGPSTRMPCAMPCGEWPMPSSPATDALSRSARVPAPRSAATARARGRRADRRRQGASLSTEALRAIAGARRQLSLHPGAAGRRQDHDRLAPHRRSCCARASAWA